MSRAQQTGFRETLLRAALRTETGEDEDEGEDDDEDDDEDDEPISMTQEYIDDPAHDAMFPGHVLSIARAAKRWHEQAEVRVEKRPAAPPRGELHLRSVSCSISAPPRFIPGETLHDGDDVFCLLNRVSFCGTDGVDRLVVTRTAERIRGLLVGRRLEKFARVRSRTLFEQLGYEAVQCEVRPVEGGGLAIEIVTEGDPEERGVARGRMLWRWFLDDTGRAWSVAFQTTVVVPLEEVSAEVAAAARSWKRHSGGDDA